MELSAAGITVIAQDHLKPKQELHRTNEQFGSQNSQKKYSPLKEQLHQNANTTGREQKHLFVCFKKAK